MLTGRYSSNATSLTSSSKDGPLKIAIKIKKYSFLKLFVAISLSLTLFGPKIWANEAESSDSFQRVDHLNPDQRQKSTRYFALSDWGYLNIESMHGNIYVTGHDKNFVEVSAIANKNPNFKRNVSSHNYPQIHWSYEKENKEKHSGLLNIKCDYNQPSLARVDFRVVVPRRILSTFYTHKGDVSAYSVNATETGLFTLEGKITVRYHRGALHVHNYHGPSNLEVYDVGYELIAQSDFGDLDVTFPRQEKNFSSDAEIKIMSKNGELDLDSPWDDLLTTEDGGFFSSEERAYGIFGNGKKKILLKSFEADVNLH